MKDLKLWQKAGLITAIVTGLTLGGLTPNYSSKGLESKIPSIGVSVAEAKGTNPDGYQIPDLTGLEVAGGKGQYLKSEPKVYAEGFFTKDGGRVVRMSYDNGNEKKIFAYGVDHDTKTPMDYTICDTDGDGIFETKYQLGEEYSIPEWVKS